MGGTRDGDSRESTLSSRRGEEVVLLLLLLPRRERVAEVRSLRGVTDVDRTGTLLTPHSSTGFEKLDKARMKPLRCFVGVDVGAGDASDRGRDMMIALWRWWKKREGRTRSLEEVQETYEIAARKKYARCSF